MDPTSWNNEQLKLNIVKLTKTKLDVDKLCGSLTGKQLLDVPEAEFLHKCESFGFTGIPAKTF